MRRVKTLCDVCCQRGAWHLPARRSARPKADVLYSARPVETRPVLSPSPAIAQPSQTRAIVLLAIGGFASQAMVRSADSLLPQIAHDLAVTIGVASVAVWAYSLGHGSMQLVIGPIGDRFGKYRIVALTCAGAAVFVAACGLTQSLALLTVT